MKEQTLQEYEELCKRARERAALKQRLIILLQKICEQKSQDKRDDWPQA